MVALYVRRLLEGTYELANVPARYKEGVKAALQAKVDAGEITAERYAEIVGEE
jgi:hypothetical protein